MIIGWQLNRIFPLILMCLGISFAGDLGGFVPNSTWIANENAPAVLIQNQQVVFDLPFQNLTTWRYYWDLDGHWDFSNDDRIGLTWKIQGSCSIQQAVVYMNSGAGWYRFPSFNPCVDTSIWWERSKAAQEGLPSGWSKIQQIRIAFLPLQKTSSKFVLRSFVSKSTWNVSDAERWGGFRSLSQILDSLHHLEGASPQVSRALLLEREYMALRDSLVRCTEDSTSPKLKKWVHQARRKIAEAFSILQSRDSLSRKGMWLNFEQSHYHLEDVMWKQSVNAALRKGYSNIYVHLDGKPQSQISKQMLAQARLAQEQGLRVVAWVDELGMRPCDLNDIQARKGQILKYLSLFSWDGLQLDNWRFGEGSADVSGSACLNRYHDRYPQVSVIDPSSDAYKNFLSDELGQRLEEIHQLTQSRNPAIPLSISVFSYPDVAKTAVMQDWSQWAHRGYIDEIHTLTLSEDFDEFRQLVEKQRNALPAHFPLYTGISIQSSDLSQGLWEIQRQIAWLRDQKMDGYTLFQVNERALDSLVNYLP